MGSQTDIVRRVPTPPPTPHRAADLMNQSQLVSHMLGGGVLRI